MLGEGVRDKILHCKLPYWCVAMMYKLYKLQGVRYTLNTAASGLLTSSSSVGILKDINREILGNEKLEISYLLSACPSFGEILPRDLYVR